MTYPIGSWILFQSSINRIYLCRVTGVWSGGPRADILMDGYILQDMQIYDLGINLKAYEPTEKDLVKWLDARIDQ